MRIGRRDFLKRGGAGLAGACLAGSPTLRAAQSKPSTTGPSADAVVMSHTTELRTPQLPPENEMSRRYLRILEKWIPVGAEYFAEWPGRPDCGHFFGGCWWYGLDTASPAEAFAVASISPEYNAAATGISRDQLREMAVKAIRYLGFTHDTGPKDCVRPSVGLGHPKLLGGTKWGERGNGFFKESQCGWVIAALGRIALLLRDKLDDETWMMLARIHEDYARRFGEMPPGSGIYHNTQLEENGWTAAGLTSSSLVLSRHPGAAQWEAAARRRMFSTCSAPQDTGNGAKLGRTTAAALAGEMFTLLPDYWAENHGMVHPSYSAIGVLTMTVIGCQLRLWGQPLPPELFWNRRRIYENFKPLTDSAGYCQAIQGMDWHQLPAVGSDEWHGTAAHASAAVFLEDQDAAAFERLSLRNTELRQEGNHGRMYDKAFAERAHDQQDPLVMSECVIRAIARLYLLHRLFGPGPAPTPEAELERKLRGVRVFPHAGFVHHRHAHGQTSLSWRNSVMALPMPRDGLYAIAPSSDTWLGRPKVKGRAASEHQVSVNVAQMDQGFAAALIMDRCQDSLRQQLLLASLPDGRVLSWERFAANEDLVLEALDQGFLQITNETFPLLGSKARGVRTLYHPAGKTDYKGWLGKSASDDIVDRLGRPPWLNVDDRMGIQFVGPGETIYHNRRYHPHYRAIADDLVLSRLERPQAMRTGEATVPLAALLIPEQNHEDTVRTELRILAGPDDTACLTTGGYLAAANFAPAGGAIAFRRRRSEVIDVYAGTTTQVRGDDLEVRLPLAGRSAQWFEAGATLRVDGDVRLDANAAGAIYVTNLGKQAASVELLGPSGAGRKQSLQPGEVKALSESRAKTSAAR